MAYSERERVAHVLRRLSMGTQPDLAASLPSASDAILAALDLASPAEPMPALPAATAAKPSVRSETARLTDAYAWWFGRMASNRRMIEERLAWFWTDHFAVSLQKVRSADLMWQYHATIRAHATGSFAEMLHAVSKGGAMLVYLDGLQNTVRERNENFAREVMELHTLGRGQYTQADVVAMARACTGWVVKIPGRAATVRSAPAATADFASYFVARRHDAGVKTLLGSTGAFDLDSALDVILAHPATARFVTGELYRALVGSTPDEPTLTRLATTFSKDWSIMALVEAIVGLPIFLADASVRTIVRSPVERLAAVMQGAGTTTTAPRPALKALNTVAYVPFFPPNAGGYPKGSALLGPQQLVHGFDLAAAVPAHGQLVTGNVLERLGIFDATTQTRAALAKETNPRMRLLLALGTPEFTLR